MARRAARPATIQPATTGTAPTSNASRRQPSPVRFIRFNTAFASVNPAPTSNVAAGLKRRSAVATSAPSMASRIVVARSSADERESSLQASGQRQPICRLIDRVAPPLLSDN
jgi:hypothetical protein